MTEALFYITTILTSAAALAVAWGIFLHGRRFDGEMALLRRFAAANFTVLAAQRTAVCYTVQDGGVEILASLPLVLLSIVMIITAMYGTAAMDRQHHKNLALWLLMLLMPCVFLLAHALMKVSGNYLPIFSWNQLDGFRTAAPLAYYGRGICVAILLVFWLLAAGMLTEAYISHRRGRATRVIDEDTEQRDGKVRCALAWALAVAAGIPELCLTGFAPHIIYNVLILAALAATTAGYVRYARFVSAKISGRLASLQIARRVPLLLAMERGGQTAWGTSVAQNPFFNGNATLDDVAQALGVRSADLSEYIQKQGVNFLAWVSDQRLRYCASQISSTNRKINEIAASCGYNDLSNFTRAFKNRFGISPSGYRKQNGAD